MYFGFYKATKKELQWRQKVESERLIGCLEGLRVQNHSQHHGLTAGSFCRLVHLSMKLWFFGCRNEDAAEVAVAPCKTSFSEPYAFPASCYRS